MALLVATGVLSGCAAGRSSTAEAANEPTSSVAPVTPHSTDSSSAGPSPQVVKASKAPRVGAVQPQKPTSVILPDGVQVPVRSVATTANGVLDVPSDINAAGWWRGGSKIGDPFGSTLVAAHVDSATQGLGPFATLLGSKPGQQIRLRSQGLVQDFRVSSLRLRPRTEIASDSYLHSPGGKRRLTLVTCAPPYDHNGGGYQNLAILIARPVAAATARQSLDGGRSGS